MCPFNGPWKINARTAACVNDSAFPAIEVHVPATNYIWCDIANGTPLVSIDSLIFGAIAIHRAVTAEGSKVALLSDVLDLVGYDGKRLGGAIKPPRIQLPQFLRFPIRKTFEYD